MAPKTKETISKEQKGRKHIANFLSAMKFHDDDLETTVKLMRKKLVEIQRKESAAAAAAVLIKKPPTSHRKIIIKFGGSKSKTSEAQQRLPPIVLHKRPHCETLIAGIEKESRNVCRHSYSKTLICKGQKMKKNNGGMQFLIADRIQRDSTQDPSCSKTLVCKRQKISGDDKDGGTQLTKVYPYTETMINDFIRSVGGSEAELVIEKRLTLSDVTQNQGRLLIPVLQVKNQGFLTADEKLKLGNKQDISVTVFDPERRKWTLNLAKWKMSKEYYVLKTNWNRVVATNRFKEDMVIRVFSFRICQKLCFALDHVA